MLQFKINLIYFVGEVVMSMALICFFLIIQTISNEAILAQDENIYDDEDETSSKMQED